MTNADPRPIPIPMPSTGRGFEEGPELAGASDGLGCSRDGDPVFGAEAAEPDCPSIDDLVIDPEEASFEDSDAVLDAEAA